MDGAIGKPLATTGLDTPPSLSRSECPAWVSHARSHLSCNSPAPAFSPCGKGWLSGPGYPAYTLSPDLQLFLVPGKAGEEAPQ